MNLSRVVAYNTFIQILGKGITVIFGITTTALLTNYLGAGGFGNYTFALSFVAIFSSIADWGTVLISVKEASRSVNQQDKIFGNTLLLRFFLSIIATIAVWIIIFLFPLKTIHQESLRSLVIFSSILILIFSLKTSLEIVFQTKLKQQKTALVEWTASFLTLILSFTIIKIGGDLFLIVSGLILANIVATVLAFILANQLSSIDFSISKSILKTISLQALPMGGVLILYSVYNRADSLILQAFGGSETVGVYGLSYRVYEVIVLGAFYLMNSILPIISQEQDKTRFRQIYQKTLDILILAGGFVFLGTLIFAPLAIKIIAWQKPVEFSQSIPLLRILGLAAFISYLNHLTGYTVVVLGKQVKYLLIALVALIFNFSLNLILIPKFSFYAAAWLTVLTEGLVFCLTSILLVKTMGFLPNFFSFPKTAWQILMKKGKIF
ncbi:MAG: flippase [Candidatus Gottesmanbacteria bacterium]